MSVSAEVIPLVEHILDPTDTWLKLQKALGTSSPNAKFNQLRLLMSIRKSTGETFHQYIANASRLFNEINGMQIMEDEAFEAEDKLPQEVLFAAIIKRSSFAPSATVQWS